ncbi:MAG: alpha-tubulin suppressor-like RCC1 family protein/sugar lactone lactonase YvrE [Akkermansiaceae bacterium]
MVTFASELSGKSIELTDTLTIPQDSTVIIDGSVGFGINQPGVTVKGDGSKRVFSITAGATAVFDSLTITGGGGGSGPGAGFQSGGDLTLNGCTVKDNNAGLNAGGGGDSYAGRLILSSSTIANNSGSQGGGIIADGTTILNHTTISKNHGGGLRVTSSGSVRIRNSIVAGNSGSDINGAGEITELGGNLIGGDPRLAELADNGGQTETMALLAGSPALDAGEGSPLSVFSKDQRGYPRMLGAGIDFGAFESGTSMLAPEGSRLHALATGATEALAGQFEIFTDRSFSPIAPPQASVLAGMDDEGNADGVAANARFHFPTGVATGTDGNLYVTDPGNRVIRKITYAGLNGVDSVVSTIAGTGGYGAQDGAGISEASFAFPSGIAVNGAGEVFVADPFNHRIRKLTPPAVSGGEWIVSTFAGNDFPGHLDSFGTNAQFNFPFGLAVDNDGNLYVADTYNHVIRKIDPSGEVSTLAGSGTMGNSDSENGFVSFKLPYGLVVDGSGNVFVADSGNHLIRKIAVDGLVTTLAGTGNPGSNNGFGTGASFDDPVALTLTGGSLYLADRGNKLIRKLTPSLSLNDPWEVTTFAGQNTVQIPGSFETPAGIVARPNGTLIVADTGKHRIQQIVTSSVIRVEARLEDGQVVADLSGQTQGETYYFRWITPTGDADGIVQSFLVPNPEIKVYEGVTLNAPYLRPHNAIVTFNTVQQEAPPETRTFTITNTGEDFELTVKDILAPVGFEVLSELPANPIAVGASWSFEVKFSTGTSGLFIGDLEILTDDLDRTPSILLLNGLVNPIYPEIAVSDGLTELTSEQSGIVAFGNTTVNLTGAENDLSRPFTITNSGDTDLLISQIEVPDGFGVVNGPAIVNVGSSTVFEIVLSAVTGGSFAGDVVITNNDMDEGVFTFPVSGYVQALPTLTTIQAELTDLTRTGATFRAEVNAQNGATDVSFEYSTDPNLKGSLEVSTLVGNPDVEQPRGMATDSEGNVYIADRAGHRILKMDPTGNVEIFAGSGTGGSADGDVATAEFDSPADIAIDSAGRLFVADELNHCIRLISNGQVSTLAGSGIAGFADGLGGEAEFLFPCGIAVNPEGTELYIADRGNHRIRKITTYNAVADISAGGFHTVALSENGTLAAWGRNTNGQLGLGVDPGINLQEFVLTSAVPLAVGTGGVLDGKNVVAISAGSYHTVALCSDGTLAAWGHNSRGQLGDGRSSLGWGPVAVEMGGVLDGKTVVAISAGSGHTVALCSDGTLAAWGNNDYGKLGDNSNNESNVPVAVEMGGVLDGKTVVGISAGSVHTVALCSDGTLAAWGGNFFGQLGDNSNNESNVPVAVETGGVLDGKTVVAISAGSVHTVALCSDGTLAAWGRNTAGQLGDNSNNMGNVPVAVEMGGVLDGKTIVAISAGSYHTVALCSDGTLAAWGNNDYGKLGDNSNDESNVPVAVEMGGILDGKTVVGISAGSQHTVALCSDGTLATWGNNDFGQLGDNSDNKSNVPVAVWELPGGVLRRSQVTTLAGNGSAGSENGIGLAAQFNHPAGVAVEPISDAEGEIVPGEYRIYVADRDNHRIRVIEPEGLVTTLAGSSVGNAEGLSGQFNHPVDVEVGSDGRVLVADRDNHRIRVIESDGTVGTFAGSFRGFLDSAEVGEHPPATSTRFDSPAGLALDTSGASDTLYVADSGNTAIRKVFRGNLRLISWPNAFTGEGTSEVEMVLVERLQPGATYYYRAVASNSAGRVEGALFSFTTPVPAIMVYEGPDNDAPVLVSDQTDEVDFGITPVNVPVTRTFTIENTGQWPLQLNSMNFPGGYGTAPSSSIVIQAGESFTQEVTLLAGSGGSFAGAVKIFSDDPEQGSFTFPVTGVVLGKPILDPLAISSVRDSATINVDPNGSDTSVFYEIGTTPKFDGVDVTTIADLSTVMTRPLGLAVDSLGNVYVSDSQNHCIRKITPGGEVRIFAGSDSGVAGFFNGVGTEARFRSPVGIVIGADDTVYVGDSGNHCIRAIQPSGQALTFSGQEESAGFTDGNAKGARFDSPQGLALGPDDTLYVADKGNNRIRLVSVSGSVSTLAQIDIPLGIAVSETGTVYVTREGKYSIASISAIGQVDENFAGDSDNSSFGNGDADVARFSSPRGLAVDALDNLFVADEANHKIRKISPAGLVTTLTGTGDAATIDGLGYLAQFNTPFSLAVLENGGLIVGESASAMIRKISPTIERRQARDVPKGAGAQVFLSLDGLDQEVSYYIRAVATNSGGETYSDVEDFPGFEPSAFPIWQIDHFGSNADNSTISGPQADPDCDGMSNLMEYAFGLDPGVKSFEGVPVVALDSGFLAITYNRQIGDPDLTYQVEWSGNLVDWSDVGVTEEILPGEGSSLTETVIAKVPRNGDYKYIRVSVTQP